MRAIWKFPLEIGLTDIEIPVGAELLAVQTQAPDTPCLWAIVNLEADRETRRFAVVGTGHPLNGSEQKYIGTFQLLGGAFVGHVFELTRL